MTDEKRPFLRIVKGNPDDAELAAVTAVLVAAASAPADAAPPARRSEWANRARALRQPLQHGPGAWRASGFPR
ncbi:acyl-CoA carboxylase subunit epsilon [Amycolatopsis acidicola]|uniref:Acyl-CoA carboxylase subunit epsilon n=1 Tax=Amycolatopsis acidicola TaxID=2596893 RepID=A0A5N0V0P3_9PSEU|nr:acyl-CoA carboxylase subunit epsilon [Amycolatopsis acidicola]KAA9158935.1 acyl-CoA carboxylase subunit epsilon [Amycolatopsis acidicola]